MKTKMTHEPVALGAGVIALVQAILIAVVALGWLDLSDVQQAAIMGVVTAAVALGGGIAVRKRVTPTVDVPTVESAPIDPDA